MACQFYKLTLTIQLLVVFFQIKQINSCSKEDLQSLVAFKNDLTDPRKSLSSWTGENCCSWQGITCNNKTGRVTRLDLHNPASHDLGLGGKISRSLINLDFLTYLDLSYNNFGDISIPKFFGSFPKLRYLNLSSAGFVGFVPPHLGNLSALRQLDLSSGYSPTIGNSGWISELDSLEYLDLSGLTFLEKSSMLLGALNTLPSLTELRLSSCTFPDNSIPIFLPYTNFSSLSILDLSNNFFGHVLPSWLFNITTLETLDLRGNDFRIVIPEAIDNLIFLKDIDLSFNQYVKRGGLPQNLERLCGLRSLYFSSMNIAGDLAMFKGILNGCNKKSIEHIELGGNQLRGQLTDWLGELENLKSLYLYGNSISGSIPTCIGSLHSLEYLDISQNHLNDSIPNSLGGLSNLSHIDLSYNSLQGIISQFHLENLKRLKELDVSWNNLSVEISDDWLPPFQLERICIDHCKLGPRFPLWLRNQFNYSVLRMSYCEINDHAPSWFWNLSSNFATLDLSHNKIYGKVMIPKQHRLNSSNPIIDLSFNLFEGSVPLFPLFDGSIDLSNNLFSGPIPSTIGDVMPELSSLTLSNNTINGSMPSSICKMSELELLDLSINRLSGKILNCWKRNSNLMKFDLSNNHFTGRIPHKISSFSSLQSLRLNNNNLSSVIPVSLKNCHELMVIDLSNNNLTGEVPTWLGKSLPSLRILSLRGNMFTGNIPHHLSKLSWLQILDLSHNNLSGTIPKGLGNMTAMKTIPRGDIIYYYITDTMILPMKNREDSYNDLLRFVTTLDLSKNALTGCIPSELSSLHGLLNLNLSGNYLHGTITNEFGQLQQLESLDLSRNYLTGPIPTSLTNLTFLSVLNLSYNNLSGRIPSGNQLSTFTDPSAYIGNQFLCGFPLPNDCETKQRPVTVLKYGENENNANEMMWMYFGLGIGFISTFWGTWCLLLFKKTWKIAYFRAADKAYDKLYVLVAINSRILKEKMRKMKGSNT